MRAKVLHNPLVQCSWGLNPAQIDMAILTPSWTIANGTCCFGKGRGSTETPSKLCANHNALGQLTNHNTFCFSEGGPSSNPELIESFVWGWGERYCNNVTYVKNNVIFEPPSMRACSSTPPKQNQDFVKEHNRTPLKHRSKQFSVNVQDFCFISHYRKITLQTSLFMIMIISLNNMITNTCL